MQLEKRTFIISGGASGLGLATAELLASRGSFVSVLDLNPPPEGSSLPQSQFLFTKTDVSSTASLEAALRATLQWTQTTSAPLSGVVCCAGIGTAALVLPKQPTEGSRSYENTKYYDMASFDRTMAINVRGSVDLIRLAVPHMALNEPWGSDSERGVVIVVSSVAAYEGQVGQLAYSASKGAVRSIVLPLARELGQKAGIRAMGVAPGVFETGMTVPKAKPKEQDKGSDGQKSKKPTGQRASVNPEMVNYPRRMGRGDEFAQTVLHIIIQPMLNGSVIRLDGGVRMPSRL